MIMFLFSAPEPKTHKWSLYFPRLRRPSVCMSRFLNDYSNTSTNGRNIKNKSLKKVPIITIKRNTVGQTDLFRIIRQYYFLNSQDISAYHTGPKVIYKVT